VLPEVNSRQLVAVLALFLRSTRHVTTTAAGREFVAMAERVLGDLRLGMRSLRELAEQQRGQVIVTSLIPVNMSRLATGSVTGCSPGRAMEPMVGSSAYSHL
jgi:hypothetical protein